MSGRLSCAICRRLSSGPLSPAVRRGKEAVARRHRALIGIGADCTVDLEDALSGHRPRGEKVFDYLLVENPGCGAHAIEVHPASSTGAVDVVIEKKWGTERALARVGQSLGATWHWLVPGSGTVAFKANDARGKALAVNGIRQPVRRLNG